MAEQSTPPRPRLAVLGVGGLGGNVALALVRAGIGEMLLVDFDRVEMSNLSRQMLYTEADIGRPKVAAAKERLEVLDPDLSIRALDRRLASQADIETAIRGCDFVADGIDWPARQVDEWVNAACFAQGIPYISMSHFLPLFRVGPLFVPGKTGCWSCQRINYRREYPQLDLVANELQGQEIPVGIIGPVCSFITGLAATQITEFLRGEGTPVTVGQSLVFDVRSLKIERHAVPLEPECKVCGGELEEAFVGADPQTRAGPDSS